MTGSIHLGHGGPEPPNIIEEIVCPADLCLCHPHICLKLSHAFHTCPGRRQRRALVGAWACLIECIQAS